MLHLHYFSNFVKFRLTPIAEEEECYSIDDIKEFEEVSPVHKEWLVEVLERGWTCWESFIFIRIYRCKINLDVCQSAA